MRFKPSLQDDSEPLYAPCLKKIRASFYWVPPKKYLEAGYSIRSYRLEGKVGDDLDIERARHCRVLTRELLEWYDGEKKGKTPGTWSWLIARYLTDEDSDIRDVKANTRKQYREVVQWIEDSIGNVLLKDTDFTRMKGWQRDMNTNGRSKSYIKRWFNHLGMILSYGIKIGEVSTRDDCVRIKLIGSEMRIKGGARRQVFITREQVEQVVAEADRRGWHHLSLSLLMRFELMLRGVDVYGQWLPHDGEAGGIQHNGQIWKDGITWSEISDDCRVITNVISKTSESMPEPYTFHLDDLPDIRRRIMLTPREQRTGPLIVTSTGRPYKNGTITRRFKDVIRHLGMDDALQLRDGRAGGITEAKAMVDPKTLQHAAQHQNQHTTDRYARDRSSSANQVIQMRAKR